VVEIFYAHDDPADRGSTAEHPICDPA